jgi:2'-5' RNA ligase
MAAEEKWRLFFAVEMPEAVRAGAEAVQRQLARLVGDAVKWVERENLHVTLKFVGYVPACRVEAVVEVGRGAATKGRGVVLRVVGAGAFPSLRRPRVLWLGLTGSLEPLAAVAQSLDTCLAQQGLAPPDNRPFQPHLTLGRVRPGRQIANLGAALQELASLDLGPVEVRELVLMRSHLRPEGPVYEAVARFPLPPGSCRGEEGIAAGQDD